MSLENSISHGYINFLLGLALGFSLAAPPGPANALIAHFSTTHSRFYGFMSGMGASSADAIILALIISTGFASVLTNLAGKNLFLVGGIVMLAFSIVIVKSYHKALTAGIYSKYKSAIPYFAGLLTNISSPYTITWWVTVGLTLVTSLAFAIFGFFVALGVVA
ncbi:MAG: LysE family transporter [Nitrososphaerales archaeon]